MKKRLFAFSLFIFLWQVYAEAQVNSGIVSTRFDGAVRSFRELQKRILPSPKYFAPNEEDEETDIEEMEEGIATELKKTSRYPNKPKLILGNNFTSSPLNRTLANSCLQFDGGDQSGGFFPPDVSLAVGFEQVVQATNNFVRVYDKNGNQLSSLSLSQFVINGNNATFDPKVVYDQANSRFIMVVPFNAKLASSGVAVCVSQSADALGGWYYYSFTADPSQNYWFDYPSVGFTSDKLVVSGNMFGLSTGQRSRTYVLDKNLLLNGSIQNSVSYFDVAQYSGGQRNIHPSINLDNNATSFCLEQSVGSGKYSLYKITGGGTSPAWNYAGEIDFSALGFLNGVTDAPQKDTAALLDMGDSRILMCVLRNGNLYFTHSVSNTNIAGVDIAVANATNLNAVVKYRWLSNGGFFGYPNITINSLGEIIGSVGYFNSTVYPSAAYVYANPGTGTNYISTVKNGQGFVVNRDSQGRNRWGDYSGTALDPADDETVWVSSDYGRSRLLGTGQYNSTITKICAPCQATRYVNNAVSSPEMKKFAGATVIAQSTISSGATVKLQGEQAVILNPGFRSVYGSNTKASIAPCNAEVPLQ